MGLRTFLDNIAPQFEDGGKLKWAYPMYEALDTVCYTPGFVTGGSSHVRDGMDNKRIMITVWLCAFIPVIVGSYIWGLNALSAMAEIGQTEIKGWQGLYLNLFIGTDPGSVWNCLAYGLGHFLPLYAWILIVGVAVEWVFAAKRGHEIGEGYFVTSILFTLSLPPSIPYWICLLYTSDAADE